MSLPIKLKEKSMNVPLIMRSCESDTSLQRIFECKVAEELIENAAEAKEVPPNGSSAATTKLDPLVSYMNDSNKEFNDKIVQPIKDVFSEFREVLNYANSSVEIRGNHVKFLDFMNKMENSFGEVLNSTKRMDSRFQKQLRQVAKKVVTNWPKKHSKWIPSNARIKAGKKKADSLKTWKEYCSAARLALKEEGYKGSFNLKKGMPMYKKIEEMRRARKTGAQQISSASGSSSHGWSVVLAQGVPTFYYVMTLRLCWLFIPHFVESYITY